jgi:eukaryotic-like serine/threonine-protein kinase
MNHMPQPASRPGGTEEIVDLTGRTVGRFAVRARLGAGGMGEVYRADDTTLRRPVALKRIAPRFHSDENSRKRFLREAQYASGLTNQNIAGVYDVLEADGEIFVVMEYVEGMTLRQRLSQPISIENVLGMALQCAAALVAAHEQGIVHRDIKPENIMLTADGTVKILDFGVAKQLSRANEATTLEGLTNASGTSSLSGTPAYMAPEVLLEKEPDQRADIFSLGVVIYEALSGRHPFLAGNFLGTCDRILHETPVPLGRLNPKVSPELERVVTKMLARDPAERYATAADLLVDLRALERPTPYPTRPIPLEHAPSAPRRNLPRLQRGLLSATVGILLITGIALLLPKLRDSRLHWFSRPAIRGAKNLAVLPFQAIGGNPENQAYCDGITETLTANLTQLTATHALQVVPAREVRARRISGAEQARKEFGVSLVLEGSMDRSGSVARVNYALVDTGTLRQVRAGTITADASDPFAVQDRVAIGMLGLLELELKPEERQAIQRHGTQVAGAYEFYLQGRGYLQNYDKPENIDHAVGAFQRALSLDPSYALAYAGLGEAYWKKYESGKDSQWVESARRVCKRAVALDPKSAAPRICLGTVWNGTGQYDLAVAEFRGALEIEPTSDDAYRGLGFAFERSGRTVEAEETYRRGIALRPHYWAGYSWLGTFYYRQARYREAAEMFSQVVALAPDSIRGYYNLGAAYLAEGRYAEANAAFERSIAIRPTDTAYTNMANVYFYQRRYDEATRGYEQAVKLNQGDYMLWRNLADGYYWTPGTRAQADGAYRQAISLAKEKLQVNPKDTSALGVLAVCHGMLGEKKWALQYLQKGLQLAPDDPGMRFKAALVYVQLGETERALDWLAKAVAAGYSATTIRDTPNFDHLHSNTRFQELLQAK